MSYHRDNKRRNTSQYGRYDGFNSGNTRNNNVWGTRQNNSQQMNSNNNSYTYNDIKNANNNNNNHNTNMNNNNHNSNNNNNDVERSLWRGGNNPTPFTASLQLEKALQNPIPRRMQINNNTSTDECKMDIITEKSLDKNRIPMVLEKDWNQYTIEDQYKLLFPYERPSQFPQLNVPFGHQQRKHDAMIKTIQYLEDELYPIPPQTQDVESDDDSEVSKHDSDEDDNDDWATYQKIPHQLQYTEHLANRTAMINRYKTFLQALPKCTPLDLGFVSFKTFIDADKFCWCPCQSQQRFWRWRNHFGVDSTLPTMCTSNSNFVPKGLLDHLEKKKCADNIRILTYQRDDDTESEVMHSLVYKYLRNCYENYTKEPRSGIQYDHIALYDVNNTQYKLAESAQNAWIDGKLKALLAEKEQSRIVHQKQIDEISNLSNINKTQADKLKEELERNKTLRDKLGIAEDSRKTVEVDKVKMLPEYELARKEIFALYRCSLNQKFNQARKKNKSLTSQPLIIEDLETTFNLAEVVQKWIEEGSELIEDLDDTNLYKWLHPLQVNFNRGGDDQERAIDEGGPSRVFLSQVWRQLPQFTLTRKVGNATYSVELFNKDCVPVPNYYIVNCLGAKDVEVEVQEQVRKTCRIIGRLILHCIAMSDYNSTSDEKFGIRLPIWDRVIPNVYRYYYFQNKDPQNPLYELSHLTDDVSAVKCLLEKEESKEKESLLDKESSIGKESSIDKELSLENKMQKYTIDYKMQKFFHGIGELNLPVEEMRKQFRDAVMTDLFHDCSWVVESMKEGLTLGGTIKLHIAFAGIPMPYIKDMLFAHKDVKVEDLIALLYPEIDETSDIDAQLKIMTNNEEKGMITGHLPDLLRRKPPSFCSDFLEFVTGSAFIPYNDTNYKICVEFNPIESKHPESLPVAHTCVKTLKFPGTAYGGDAEKLEEKLTKAIAYCKKNGFQIR